MKFFDTLNFASRPKIEMSSFDMSHEHKTTLAFGKICPVFMQEVLPGDKWHITPSAFLRTMPLLSPMMHRLDLKMRFFFVPNRLIWSGWEKFISRGSLGRGDDEFVPSFVFDGNTGQGNEKVREITGFGSLLDYFGFPVDNPHYGLRVSQLPFRAYDLVVSEYFRNNLIDIDGVVLSEQGAARYDALNSMFSVNDKAYADKSLRLGSLLYPANLCWENDYFTSASTSPLGVEVGLSGNMKSSLSGQAELADHIEAVSGAVGGDGTISVPNDATSQINNRSASNISTTVNDLRQAYRLQHFLETGLRYGRKYVEQLFGHFGVESSDARLQRPEYLGGGSLAVQVSEVASTSNADQGRLGDLAGRGLSVGNFSDIDFTSEEHGFIIGVAYLSPHSSYYGGIPRTFLRSERLDFAFPEFADLGQQPLWLSEIDSTDDYDDDGTRTIFGYVPRYSEYKQAQDRFSGDMVKTLEHWHLGRDFHGTSPKLNDEFVYITDAARVKLNRVFGVTDAKKHPFVATFGFNATALRPLPYNPQNIF